MDFRFQTFSFHALGGPCSLQLYAQDEATLQRAAAATQAEVLRIEAKYSRYRADSLLSQINAAAGTPQRFDVDAETTALLNYAAAAYEQSDGLFDATSGVLRRAWDFRAGRVPEQAELDALLPLIGWHQVERGTNQIRLPLPGMQLDFGGFGKEYAADRAAAALRGAGIQHGLVELGGDLVAVGPHPDGAPWRVGIRHPQAPESAIAIIEVDRGAVASSGDYERSFVRDGRRYSHILDPRSGWPVQGLSSVSVLAEQCLVAGTAATIALLKGHGGIGWLRPLGLPWLAVSTDGRIDGSIAVTASVALMPARARPLRAS